MSAETLKLVAMDYQKGLLDRLNNEVKDTQLRGKPVYEAVKALAPRRDQALAFNYASQALNNSFFLDTLQPPRASSSTPQGMQGHEHMLAMRQDLGKQIESDFGSLIGLKSAFSAAAMGMAGSGWVWLVCDATGKLAVIATYGSGTVLVRSQTRLGPKDWVLHEEPTSTTETPATPISKHSWHTPTLRPLQSPFSGARFKQSLDPNPITPSRSTSTVTSSFIDRLKDTHPKLGETLMPLFTCSIHEHCWLRDHGIWGKEAYLRAFWDVLDWEKVGSIWAEFRILSTLGR